MASIRELFGDLEDKIISLASKLDSIVSIIANAMFEKGDLPANVRSELEIECKALDVRPRIDCLEFPVMRTPVIDFRVIDAELAAMLPKSTISCGTKQQLVEPDAEASPDRTKTF